MRMRPCSVDGCGNATIVANGMCNRHYRRWRKHGDPSIARQPVARVPPERRFWPKVNKTATCWLWTAYVDADGYGHFKDRDRDNMAHRWAYETLVEPIAPGLTVDHLCRVKRCVNPSHMELVSIRENVRRSGAWDVNASKTHCPRGHPYSLDNTYYEPSNNARKCRTCMRERDRLRHR